MNDELMLDERVDVVARFGTGLNPCEPVKFRRKNGREVVVTEIGLRTPLLAGRKMVHLFDVTDGEADYRLEFDCERLTWRLTMEGDRVL